MAKSKQDKSNKVPRKKQSTSFTKKLAIILILLSILTISIISTVNYYFESDFNIDDSDDGQIYNNLDLATKPFDGGHEFPLEHVLDDGPVWGSLNSGHYFSLKLSSPNSLETSMLWFANKLNENYRLNIRHLCDQNDGLNSYSWFRHNFYNFGEQLIEDNGYRIRTSYIKNPSNNLEWKAKIDVEFDESKKLKPLSVIQYITSDRERDWLMLKSSKSNFNDGSGTKKLIEVTGYSKDTGDFSFSINIESNKKNFIAGNHFVGNINKQRYPISYWLLTKLQKATHNSDRLFVLPGFAKIQKNPYIEDDLDKDPNIIAYELILSNSASFTVDFKQLQADTSDIFNQNYDSMIENQRLEFDRNFFKLFPVQQLKLKTNQTEESVERLAKVSLSNMIGSIGYFYGHSYISTETNKNKIVPYGPIQLLTGVPSRSFFPRGFLWDEAFHNLLISQFDPDLSNSIIKSWFNLMNFNGWIPREVILGPESMRRVPEEFIIQRITNANPPAMFIVIRDLLNRGKLDKRTLNSIYPKLKTWYRWFNDTQSGPKPGTFRWRGRDELSVNMLNPKTLTSGLDDYPRPSHPSPLEYHIDLRCWMAFSAKTLADLSGEMNDDEYHRLISREADQLFDNKLLDDLHWSEKDRMYCDFGYNTDKAELIKVTKTRRSRDGNRDEKYQALERHSSGHPEFGCVNEFGYVSIFPMLFNILDPKSKKLGILLERISNREEVWSDFGIRSLSKLSKYYNKYNTEHDKPYWRGAVWINLNYLILSSLDHYSKLEGPYKERCAELSNELRDNLVKNVLNEYSRTNYTWENYDDQTGKGKGSHPFTGWSSLILLMMSGTKPVYI